MVENSRSQDSCLTVFQIRQSQGREQHGRRAPPSESSEPSTVAWTQPQTEVAVGKAHAVSTENPIQLFHLPRWVHARAPVHFVTGHSWDLSEDPKGKGYHPSVLIRSPL